MVFETRELSPAGGVEISGLDVNRPLTEAEAAELKAIFDRHKLVLVRDVELDDDEHMRLCSYLRPVVDAPAYVSNIPPLGFHPEHELRYHSDYTFTPWPLLGISLYAMVLDGEAAPTRFVNTALALERLPEPLRSRLETLDIVMMTNTTRGESVAARHARVPEDAPRDVYPRHVHPAIDRHPETGEPFLIVGEQQASHFVGLSWEESDALLDELFAALYDDANVYEHHWKRHDLIVWDNLAVQHGRRANPNAVRRSLRRITMSTHPQSELIAGTVYEPRVAARQ